MVGFSAAVLIHKIKKIKKNRPTNEAEGHLHMGI